MVPKKKSKFLIFVEHREFWPSYHYLSHTLMLVPILTAESQSSEGYIVKSQLEQSILSDTASARIPGAPGEISAFNFVKISSQPSESFISFVISLAVFKESPNSLIVFIVS